jgi:GNAT superfamily N-acetyltransferase
MRIEEYEPQALSEAQWRMLFGLYETLFRETHPRDPLPSQESRKGYMLDPNPLWQVRWWWVLSDDGSRVLGIGGVDAENERSPSYQANKHIAVVDMALDPQARNLNDKDRGWALETRFLRALVSQVREMGKTIVKVDCQRESQIPFWKAFGRREVSRRTTNRLALDAVDWDLMQRWREQGSRRAEGVSLESFFRVPERDIEAFCGLFTETWNQAPTAESGAFQLTAGSRRSFEEHFAEQGYDWTTLITREPEGAISGLTEVFYLPEEAHRIEQGLTGVRRQYRGRGLGKWLKAEMLFHIQANYPTARFVDTSNATDTAAMLSINERMGFRPYLTETVFEFDTQVLCQKLRI